MIIDKVAGNLLKQKITHRLSFIMYIYARTV